MSLYFDMDGNPMTLKQWATAMESHDRWQLLYAEPPRLRISTVWLGLDHSLRGAEPEIFESMVWVDGDEVEQQRYATQEEAEEGHRRLVHQYQTRKETVFR